MSLSVIFYLLCRFDWHCEDQGNTSLIVAVSIIIIVIIISMLLLLFL